MKDVADRLTELANLYKQKNKLYKDNYKIMGNILHSIFPDGAFIRTPEEFNRFFLLIMLVHKITRASRSFPYGAHDDSLDDLAVYSQMLREYDDSTNT